MLTRRKFQIAIFLMGAAGHSGPANSQQGDAVTIRARIDESVRAGIPAIVQRNLKIEPDASEEGKELARRSPPGRVLPIILIIVGAIAVTELLEMIKELARQVYYGGVVIDMRSQPPSVTNDLKIPADMIFVIGSDGKTSRYTNDQFSLDALKLAFELK
jgi:hypothetical protein